MEELIEKIKHKFGMSAELTIYMDKSGHIIFAASDKETDEDFETVSFYGLNHLYEILGMMK
jgi:hypothetical protein